MKSKKTFTHSKIGQNFLIDKNIAMYMCRRAAVGPNDIIMEIGPGKGMLTRHLLEAGPHRLFAIEIDRRFSTDLSPLEQQNTNLEIIWSDALQMTCSVVSDASPNKIIANIPYQITTDLLWMLLEKAAPMGAAYFLLMVQKEAADRLLASPGTRSSNPLSVTLAKMGSSSLVKVVPPEAFSPRPKVQSAILEIRLDLPCFLEKKKKWRYFVEASYKQRRKTLLNNLVHGLHAEREMILGWFCKTGIGVKQRAEELKADLWDALYEEWIKSGGRNPDRSARRDSSRNLENGKDDS